TSTASTPRRSSTATPSSTGTVQTSEFVCESPLTSHRLGPSYSPVAQMAELVDAHGSGPCAARREGSSPFLGTNFQNPDCSNAVGVLLSGAAIRLCTRRNCCLPDRGGRRSRRRLECGSRPD